MCANQAIAKDTVTYHSTKVDDLDIFYREAGPANRPTILLLHGLPSSSRMFQRLLKSKLNSKYHMIAPDYPGFVHSSWPKAKTEFEYTFDHIATVMEHFCDQQHIGKHTLFMQDYGGPIGFRLGG
jgi:pimeloyl-ACP methyl ester carboxylesterase